MGVYIIAEAGVNHNGSLEIAKKLVNIAKESGADCVKFQTFKTENLVSQTAKRANYQKKNTESSDTQFNMLKELELDYADFAKLKEYCSEVGIDFLSTGFDIESVVFLDSIGMDTWKIPSGDITNYPLLKKIANFKKNVILSTGMSTLNEVEMAVSTLKEFGTNNITLLHCTTEYPAPLDEVNLSAMDTLKKHFNLPVGYSDHTEGIEIPIAAVGRGAIIIEKHFTIDKKSKGPDHRASIEPDELKLMVKAIRNVEISIGDGDKLPSKSEIGNKEIARKSIVAKSKIFKGEAFTENNLTVKRPGIGISPMNWKNIIGLISDRDYDMDEMIIYEKN